MDEFFIGAGALLTAGPAGSIAAATLHAQPEDGLGRAVRAAVVDFEGTQSGELTRLLIAAAGWTASRFRVGVIEPLLERRECSLADVIATLAEACAARDVHVFARWTPDAVTSARLSDAGVRLVAHPLEAIGQAALVSGQRLQRWRSRVRAA